MANTIMDSLSNMYIYDGISVIDAYKFILSIIFIPLGLSFFIRNRHTIFAKRYAATAPQVPTEKWFRVPIEIWILLAFCVPAWIGIASVTSTKIQQHESFQLSWGWLLPVGTALIFALLDRFERSSIKKLILEPYWAEKQRKLTTPVEDEKAPLVTITSDDSALEAQPPKTEETVSTATSDKPRRTWRECFKYSPPKLTPEQLTPASVAIRLYGQASVKGYTMWILTLNFMNSIGGTSALWNLSAFVIMLGHTLFRFVTILRLSRRFVETEVAL